MIRLPIGQDKHDALMRTLRSTHQMRLDVHVKDTDEKSIGHLTAPASQVLSGSVDVDSTADVTHTLSLTILDPNGKLRIEHNAPSHGAVFLNRFIKVDREVFIEEGYDEWVKIPCFMGPVTGYERDGPEVTIEAMGKEVLLQDPHFCGVSYTIDKGTSLRDAIIMVARKMGEKRFRVPHLGGQKLKKIRSVSRQAQPWNVIAGGKRVEGVRLRTPTKKGDKKHGGKKNDPETEAAGGLVRLIEGHYLCFYNAQGQLVVRKGNKHPVVHFKEGRDLLSRPTLTYDSSGFRNQVTVLGGQGKSQKHNAEATATLSPKHPLSPHALRRGDSKVSGIYQEWVKSDNLTEKDACLKHAKEVLHRLSRQSVDASFDCLPIPMVEPDDWAVLETDDYKQVIQLKQYTIPLTSGDPMSIGRHRKVHPRKRKHSSGGAAGPGGKGGKGGTGGKHKPPKNHKPPKHHGGGGGDGGGGGHKNKGGGGHGGGHHGGGHHHHHHKHRH